MKLPDIAEYERRFEIWEGDTPTSFMQIVLWVKHTEEGKKFIKELYEELEKKESR